MLLKLRNFLTASLGRQVIIAYSIGVAISIVFLISAGAYIASQDNNVLVKMDVSEYSKALAKRITFDKEGRPVGFEYDENFVEPWIWDSLKDEITIRVVDQVGSVGYDTSDGMFWQNSVKEEFVGQNIHFSVNGRLYDSALQLITHNDKDWFVQIAVSRRFMAFAHETFGFRYSQDGIIIFALVLTMVFGTCAHFTLKYALSPLKRISTSASEISPQALDVRMEEKGIPEEILPLIQSFNHVLSRLQQGYQLQQEFLSTAAHELKTPLSLIKSELDVMPDSEEKHWLLCDVNYMTRQVQQLLMLAEVSDRQNFHMAEFNVCEVLSEVTTYLERMAKSNNVALLMTIDEGTTDVWWGDKSALFTLLKNLIENSIIHANQHDTIDVIFQGDRILVRDQGEVVEQSLVEKMFDKFWRGENRKETGAGLGLSICKEIALAHNWSLTATSNLNKGICVSLSKS